MSAHSKRTAYSRAPLTLAGLLACASFGLFGLYLSRVGGWPSAAPSLVEYGFAWGAAILPLQALLDRTGVHIGWDWSLGCALLGWALSAVFVASGVLRAVEPSVESPPPTSAPMPPRLARYRDFYWSTLAAYGGGIFLSEVTLVLLHTALTGGALGSLVFGKQRELSPLSALSVASLAAVLVAFVAGFLGTARARRLSLPEATLGLLYFGLPLPMVLTAIFAVPELTLSYGHKLREVMHVAALIGRPEVSVWLAFAGLVLSMLLGITFGFVVTGSGKADLKARTELFIARRHVSVFRPRLLLGGLAVLLFGIIPPLLVYAILRATEAAVERTRIRHLGAQDPMKAAQALHRWKEREQSPTAMMTALSVGGVGVGTMALIIVLSVMSGFELDLQKKILGTNAHAVVMKYSDDFTEFPAVIHKAKEVQGVVGATPFILNEVMVSSEANIAGSLIKGVEPETAGEVTDLPEYVEKGGGKLSYLSHPEQAQPPRVDWGGGAIDNKPAGMLPRAEAPSKPVVLPGIILGKELAAALKVVVGDRVNVVSPLGGELGPSGPMPKSRPFRVVGLFYSGMYEYDSKFVYITLKEAQSFFGLKGVTGIELKFSDVDDARRLSQAVLQKLEGYPYRTKDWGEMNKNLFAALRLEKLVMGIILSIIVVVAAGLIVATVIMLVLEKRKEISVLKALGVSDGGIVKIFLAEGLQIGVAGSVLGLIAGLCWCVLIEKVGIRLDPEVYYIPALPVRVEPLQTAIPVVIAVLVTFLASVYPALKASLVEPVEGLKAE